MRVLFTIPPALGHLFPTVSLAWALRSAGHEVLVASSASALPAAVHAGLPAVDVAPDTDFAALFERSAGRPEERAENLRERGKEIARASPESPEIVFQQFAKVSDAMTDSTLRLAKDWRPDLVVYSKLQGSGLAAARLLDIPAVEHGFNFLREGNFAVRYLPHLESLYKRNGVPFELPVRSAIHIAPPHMMTGTGTGWRMRYVPYNAGGSVPDWLIRPAPRPRVAITLGTVLPTMTGTGGLKQVLRHAADIDADFILALGSARDTTDLGPLPTNVHPVSWVPLHSLLAGCRAIVHHGGAGTALTSISAGVPQLVLPHAADQFLNARIVMQHGLGIECDPEHLSHDDLVEVCTSNHFRATAHTTATNMAHQSSPADIVPRLDQFARHRA